MGAIVQALGQIALWFGEKWAAKLGVRLAMISVVVACFLTIYGAMIAAVLALVALIPDSGFSGILLQFFPDASAIAIAGSAYWGSLTVKKSWDYWRMALTIAVQVSA